MLRCLDLKAAAVERPLLDAATAIATKGAVPGADDFLRQHSKWRRQLRAKGDDDARLREVAVMFHLRDALRSGDIWLDRSHRYGDQIGRAACRASVCQYVWISVVAV